ncbi:ParB N-terminal domain-containing protein [Streptomyces sp. NPDC004520]|uniref:ParB N-terminal domain-containing protein n=1 Tax=Streptomyces sp. NPDC004520 TaxID=3364702 RepID=UPI003679F182
MTTKTKAKTPRTAKAPAPVWERLTVAQLAAQAAGVEPEADLTDSVRADGVTDPLYVVTSDRDGGIRVIDGIRRLAAAVAAGCDTVPVTYRPVIPVAALAAHPGNVRKDLKTSRMRASLRAEGMRHPVSVTRTADGLRVTDGHRRLAAALAEKWTHVPYAYEERTEADQYVDMVTTSVERESLTLAEEAAALFAASELGEGVRRLAAASGRKQAEVKEVLRIGASGAALAAAAAKEGRKWELSLEELGRLADLEALDKAAAAKVAAHIEANPDKLVDYEITRELHAAQRRADAKAHRVELEAAGARILLAVELSQSARPLSALKDVTPKEHETCQGHAWVLEDDRHRYTPHCTNHALFGHTEKATEKASSSRQTPAERKAIIHGGRDWDAAEERRREWLTKLISRKTHPRALTDQLTAVTALAMIQGAYVMAGKLSHNGLPALVARFTGARDESTATLNALAENPKRAAVNTFAVIAGCHEKAMPRTTWRTDAEGDAIYTQRSNRKVAARYLGWLVTLGFEPSPIEQAVLDGETYDPAAHAITDGETITDGE